MLLRYRADLRSIAFVLLYFFLIGFAYTQSLPWWGTVGLCLFLCLLSFFCAVITHNTVHAPIFTVKPLNKLFQVLLTLTYGHPVSTFVPGHNLSHHKHTQTPKDAMRTSKLRFRWNILNQIFFAWVVGPPILRANLAYAAIMRKKNPVWFRQFILETAFYFLYLGLALWLDWQKFLLFVVIPHQYASWGIMGINFVQHDGCDPEHPYNHSRNFTGKVVNWFTFNNGYHGLHHMKPSLHWSLLPEVHAKEVTPHIHPALEQRSLLIYLWKAYIWPGTRLRYDGQPMLLPPPVEDESWLPTLQEQPEDPSEMGALS